jgi:lipopolysaccharide export system permease protein
MKILDRYLIRQYLAPIGYCLVAFVLMQTVYALFHDLSRFLASRTPVLLAAFFLLCEVVPTLDYLIPSSLFLATLYTLWRLTRHSEVPAMQSSGISLPRILLPFLGVGLAFTLVSVAIKEIASPSAREWADAISDSRYQRPAERCISNAVYYNARAHRVWTVDRFDLDAPSRLVGVSVIQERPDGSRDREFLASSAEWLDGEWWFADLRVRGFDAADNPIGQSRARDPSAPAVATPMPAFTEEPNDLLVSIKGWDFLSTAGMLRNLRLNPPRSREARARREYDVHSRIALPWACIVVTLFGVPAGVKGGRHSALASILLAIGFFFGYYLLTHVGLFLGKRHMLSPLLAAWFSNLVFLVIGSVMLIRMK